jgi:hypothetical protein
MNTSNTLLEAPVLDAARSLYQGENLALPPVPAALAPRLRRINATTYASRDLDWTLYDFRRFLDELQSGKAVEPYVAFGLAGHGLTSQAAHYYAVTDHCALLFQMRWGTPMNRPDEDRASHDAVLTLAQRLQETADAMGQSGKLPAGQRIVVAESSFHGARWAWMPANAAQGSEPAWHASRNGAIVDALIALKKQPG